MELKKCANHPWLVEGYQPEADLSTAELAELVESSGTMQLLLTLPLPLPPHPIALTLTPTLTLTQQS